MLLVDGGGNIQTEAAGNGIHSSGHPSLDDGNARGMMISATREADGTNHPIEFGRPDRRKNQGESRLGR